MLYLKLTNKILLKSNFIRYIRKDNIIIIKL